MMENKTLNYILWTLQAILALVFIFSGGSKLVLPVADMLKQMPIAMSGTFLRFIGVCEVLGGLALILPGLFKIKTFLAPLAAAGLTIIMIGAVSVTLMAHMTASAILPFVVGLLTAFVAYARWKIAPHQTKQA